ncbi:MAG: beta-N-acetylhexosaminidase, partial [Candidatus Eremiobacteraeota bacterium]|nr:beta-N-acetylhexosaminidase [Candidatus Eremiobacteraeota bacterium]
MNRIEDLAAGVLCSGFDATSIDAKLEAQLRALPLAGVILFARNVTSLEQTRALTDRIRDMYGSALSPIIAIDQEGGRVARLRHGVEALPSMMALAAAGDVELARRAGEQLGFDLRRAGCNVDFAPVLDLALFGENTVIGARSFGDDTERVAELGASVARGLESAGMVATYKHFPGHGSTATDSHLDLPIIEMTEEELRARDLVPFARVLGGARAVMTAHIVVRAIDPDHPATLSGRLLTGLLRGELGFNGVCFTDCMEMDAIRAFAGTSEGAVQALIAGADCVLISHSLDLAQQSVERISEAVASGRLSRQRLQSAFDRVGVLRSSLAAPLPLDAPPPHAGIGCEIGRRAVTLLRGEPGADAPRSVVVSFEGTTVEGAQGVHSLHASLAQMCGGGMTELIVPLDPSSAERDAL